MKPEKAISHLRREVKGYTSPVMRTNYREYRKALDTAVTAIERCMIPQKPDYEGDGYDDKGELIYDTAYCPVCRHQFEIDYDTSKYCPECGQVLDWSDTE